MHSPSMLRQPLRKLPHRVHTCQGHAGDVERINLNRSKVRPFSIGPPDSWVFNYVAAEADTDSA